MQHGNTHAAVSVPPAPCPSTRTKRNARATTTTHTQPTTANSKTALLRRTAVSPHPCMAKNCTQHTCTNTRARGKVEHWGTSSRVHIWWGVPCKYYLFARTINFQHKIVFYRKKNRFFCPRPPPSDLNTPVQHGASLFFVASLACVCYGLQAQSPSDPHLYACRNGLQSQSPRYPRSFLVAPPPPPLQGAKRKIEIQTQRNLLAQSTKNGTAKLNTPEKPSQK